MRNKLVRGELLRFGLLWWLSVLMPAVTHITWHDNLGVSLPLVSSNSISSEELTRKESLSSNQLATINMSCNLYHVRTETGHNQ